MVDGLSHRALALFWGNDLFHDVDNPISHDDIRDQDLCVTDVDACWISNLDFDLFARHNRSGSILELGGEVSTGQHVAKKDLSHFLGGHATYRYVEVYILCVGSIIVAIYMYLR